jgi:hypothetical protein
MVSSTLSLLLLLLVGTPPELRGTQPGAQLGTTLVCAPELDHGGDASTPTGPFEVLIGAPGYDAGGPGVLENSGALLWVEDLTALVAPLPPGGFMYLDSTAVPGALLGSAAREEVGRSAAFGDVDGDGRSEILVGRPGLRLDALPNGPGMGRASLFAGPAALSSWTSIDSVPAAWTVEIGAALGPVVAELGAQVALLDVEGDGFDDLLCAAPALPPAQLEARPAGAGVGFVGYTAGDDIDLSAGPELVELREFDAGFVGGDQNRAGGVDRLHALGDLDGDGQPEVALTDLGLSPAAPGNAAVHVFLSTTTPYPGLFWATEAWLHLIPTNVSDALGWAVATGELTGDGEVDLVVGAPGWQGTGAVAVFAGPIAGSTSLRLSTDALILQGRFTGSQLGWSLAVEDLDGDGIDDLVAGAPARAAAPGALDAEVLVVFGGPALAAGGGTAVPIDQVTRYRIEGVAEDGAGSSLCVPGDLDADGFPDLLVGAPWANVAAGLEEAGRVWVARSSEAPDQDGDGVRAVHDCDDSDPQVHPARPEDPIAWPAAPEICDGKDSDCDGTAHPSEVDQDGDGWMICAGDCNDDPAAGGPAEQLDDADLDGFNTCGVDPASVDLSADLNDASPIEPDPAEVDCDDADADVFPGNPEVDDCDGKDNDCDGLEDEDGKQDFYRDDDRDGWGSDNQDRVCWSAAYATRTGDCDDHDPNVHPGQTDPPNDGIDQDCDGKDFAGGEPCGCGAAGGRASPFSALMVLFLGVLSAGRRRISGRAPRCPPTRSRW